MIPELEIRNTGLIQTLLTFVEFPFRFTPLDIINQYI